MNQNPGWYTALEQKRAAALFALILVATAVLVVNSLQDWKSYDSYWHLKMGQDWIENGLSPWQDNYSFTHPGERIDSPPVFFQSSLHLAVKWLGIDAAHAFYLFVAFMLILLAMLTWLRRIGAPVLAYCLIVPSLLILLQTRTSVRPEHFSYVLCIASLMLYHRARSGVTAGNMLPIAALMLFWTNYHSAILGYVIFFGLFVDLGIRQWSERAPAQSWVRWFAWGALIVGVGFLNPGFSHPVISMLMFPEEWKNFIIEYQPPLIYKNVPAMYVLLLIAAVTLVQLFRQRQIGYLLVCLVLVANASTMARMVAPAGIVVLGIFGYLMTDPEWTARLSGAPTWRKRTTGALAFVIFLIPLLNSVAQAGQTVKRSYQFHYPAGMIDYMKSTGTAGRIFNEYEIGGYLLYHLAPDSQVYIDGRSQILYPLERFYRLYEALNSTDVLNSEIEQFDIEYFIVRNSAKNARLMLDAGPMKLDFADVRYFLYTRDDANFPLTGWLWARPQCWIAAMDDELAREHERANRMLPEPAPVNWLLDAAMTFSSGEDRETVVAKLADMAEAMDPVRRFSGYRLIDLGEYDLAIRSFDAVTDKRPKDFLAVALALLRAGDLDRAEKTLFDATRDKPDTIYFIDVLNLQRLLEEIRQSRPFRYVGQEYFDTLTGQLAGANTDRPTGKVDTASFCAVPVDF
ncbi:MAG: hypothetical protein GWP58_13790 [Gammaproteobacteria bacterium]|jgi:hypothetical protein|nr:hypothetical protein [Gammaproteobacteria bacterium]